MSSRRRRQQQQQQEILAVDSNSEEEDDDEEEFTRKNAPTSFLQMMENDDDDDSSSSEEEEIPKQKTSPTKPQPQPQPVALKQEKIQEKEDEDLDAILSEFQQNSVSTDSSTVEVLQQKDDILRKDLCLRDCDLKTSMRLVMLGAEPPKTTNTKTKIKKYVFGIPKKEWGRPPTFIGGGLGMTSKNDSTTSPPWPYTQDEEWLIWNQSDTYQSKVVEFQKYIQSSGDINALVYFVLDHPFITESLYALSKALQQFQDTKEYAQELLHRILYIYECAALPSFFSNSTRSTKMDYRENHTFFQTLQTYLQISTSCGCMKTSLAISRLILSLDPLRDPMNVLLNMDYYALTSNQPSFIIQLVESKSIVIHHRVEEVEHHSCDLLEMPNWSFSYALALYQFDKNKKKADEALQHAIQKFPFVPKQILLQNNMNDNSDDACHHIYSISKNATIWNSNDKWMKWLTDIYYMTTDYNNNETILPSKALQRYFQYQPDAAAVMLPADANPLDPALFRQVVQYDATNARHRRRNLRLPNNRQEHLQQQIIAQAEQQQHQHQHQHQQADSPLERLDPDMPIAELFWRSFLPWTTVDGVNNNRYHPNNNP